MPLTSAYWPVVVLMSKRMTPLKAGTDRCGRAFLWTYVPRATIGQVMFTVGQQDALRDRVLSLAERDQRVTAGAAVGSLALGRGDPFSDLDLTFAVADDVPVTGVLDDWTRALRDEYAAVKGVDLERGSTTYRV